MLERGRMGAAKCFEELIAWQLAVQLREEVFKLTENGRVARDKDFCDQIRDSSRSAPRNLAEGFDKFARYTRIARGSLGETKNHILDGRARGHFTADQTNELLSLQRRSHIATTRLLAYLESCKGTAPAGWKSNRKKPGRTNQVNEPREPREPAEPEPPEPEPPEPEPPEPEPPEPPEP
jgi:four helix bundle protein